MGIYSKIRNRRLPLMLTQGEAEVTKQAAALLGTTSSSLFRDATLPKAVATVSEAGNIVDAAEALRTDITNQRRFTLVVEGTKVVMALMDLADLVDEDLGSEYKALAGEIRNTLNKARKLDEVAKARGKNE